MSLASQLSLLATRIGQEIKAVRAEGTKTSALTAQTAAGLVLADQLLTLDISDTTQGAGGSLKKIEADHHAAGMRLKLSNRSTARVIDAAGATDTFLTGSNVLLPTNYPIAGTVYRCQFDVTKTAAGTAIPIVIIRIGTTGTTSDAVICTLTFGAGTAVVDSGLVYLMGTFRSVGSGTAAVLVATAYIAHTAGITTVDVPVPSVSAGFNSTTAGLIISSSWNGGTAAVHTVESVVSDIQL